ncbi:MAG: tetratricopeptide repeat protein [Kofleriaceae bacterium]
MRRSLSMLVAQIAAIAIVSSSATAFASPGQELDKARHHFRAKDCQSAFGPLRALLYPSEQLAQRNDLVEAHAMLGACFFDTGQREDARSEFEKVLQLQPDKTLSDLLFSSGSIKLFEETKSELVARAQRDAEIKKLAEDRERLRKYRESLVVYETHPYYVNFVPFGAGQFQNKERGKGLFFASTQVITGGASAGIFLYLATQYGLNAKVPLEDGPRVRRLQQIEIGTGIAFLGLYAWGVVDSLLRYKPRAQIQGDDSLLPPDLRNIDKRRTKPKKTSLLDRIRVAPMITPSGVGIGLGLED